MFGVAQIVPSIILLLGVINDIKSRKVRNPLVLACAIAAILFVVLNYGWSGLGTAGLSALAALILFLPFVLAKTMGAGDMKLFIAFAISVTPQTTINVFLYSLIWGLLLGLFKVILSGRLKKLITNTINIAQLKTTEKSELHQIPYTVALLFGWLTYLSLSQYSGAQLW